MAIVDSNGTQVASYTYDAWGKVLTQTGSMAWINPLRYRGYVYDNETQLYYLQSRYYDPELGRFINADALISTGQGILGNNMFAYCNNNPANNVDPTGHALVQMRFDPDGASGLLTPGPWGGGSGGVAYAAGVVSSFSREEFVEAVVNSKMYQITEVFVSNIEASVGFGMGLRASTTILELIGLDLGLSYDLVSVTLSDGRIGVDQKFWCGVEATFVTISIDESESGQRAYGTSTWQTVPPSDAINIWGGAAYLYAGGSYSISFRANSFFAELSEILFG